MIEKMKKVCVVASASRKEEMLAALRDLGILHLADKKAASRESTERFSDLSRALMALSEFKPEKESETLLSDEEFEKVFRNTLACLDRRTALVQERGAAATEADRVRAWGEFSPAECRALADEGFDLHFYRMTKKDCAAAAKDEGIRLIRLAPVDKMETVAVLGKLPPEISATEFILPEKSLSELQAQIAACDKGIADCAEELKKTAVHAASFKAQLLKTQNEEIWSSASATAESDSELVWLSGYIPEAAYEETDTSFSVRHPCRYDGGSGGQ